MRHGARDEEALLPGWHGQEGGQPDTSRRVVKFLPKRCAIIECEGKKVHDLFSMLPALPTITLKLFNNNIIKGKILKNQSKGATAHPIAGDKYPCRHH
jgi:hypothetical protein